MRKAFIDSLVECAREDSRIMLLSVDLGFSIVEKFAEEFPERFLNVGIQEQNAVSFAAGLALSGKIVYVYTIIPFITMRCYEQVRVDAAYQRTQVRLVGVGAGYSYGPAGSTHHAVEDLALMRSLPGMTVLAPGDPLEVKALVKASKDTPGPVYLRLGKGGEACVHEKLDALIVGDVVELARGTKGQILVTSNMLETGAALVQSLKSSGVDVGLTSCPSLKPFADSYLEALIARGVPIITLEEHTVIGGLGSLVAEKIAESGRGVKFRRFGIPDVFTHAVGSQQFLRKKYGLDVESLQNILLKEFFV